MVFTFLSHVQLWDTGAPAVARFPELGKWGGLVCPLMGQSLTLTAHYTQATLDHPTILRNKSLAYLKHIFAWRCPLWIGPTQDKSKARELWNNIRWTAFLLKPRKHNSYPRATEKSSEVKVWSMPHRTLAVQSYAGTLAMIKPSPGVVLAPTRGSYYTRATSCSLLESTTWRKHNLVTREHNLVAKKHNLVTGEHHFIAIATSQEVWMVARTTWREAHLGEKKTTLLLTHQWAQFCNS